MKLSIVIICWNDWKVIENCLTSIRENTNKVDYEVIVSDNGSTDGSIKKIRKKFPAVRVVENGENLGFAKGNNAGIRETRGEYVLILNPDTVIHDGSLDRWIEFADKHSEVGAFGCRVQNPDGTYQRSARPFPTISRHLVAASGLGFLGCLKYPVLSDEYVGWVGDTERKVDWQSGCCVLLRGKLLKELGGFDERFFYQFEEVDLWGASRYAAFRFDLRSKSAETGTAISTSILGKKVQGDIAESCWLDFVFDTPGTDYKIFFNLTIYSKVAWKCITQLFIGTKTSTQSSLLNMALNSE